MGKTGKGKALGTTTTGAGSCRTASRRPRNLTIPGLRIATTTKFARPRARRCADFKQRLAAGASIRNQDITRPRSRGSQEDRGALRDHDRVLVMRRETAVGGVDGPVVSGE